MRSEVPPTTPDDAPDGVLRNRPLSRLGMGSDGLLDGLPFAAVMIGADRRIQAWNPMAEQLFGWTAPEVLGRPMPAVPLEKAAEFNEVLTSDLHGGQQIGRAIRRQRKDGSWIDLNLWSLPVRDTAGTIVASIGFFADVTARTQAEAALAARTQQLEAIRNVTREITRALELPELLNLIIEHAARLVGAVSGAVYLWDDSEQCLRPGAWVGHGEWIRDVRFRLGEGVAGTVAQRQRGLIVPDFRNSPYAHSTFLDLSRHTAVLAEPLSYDQRLVGTIALDRDDTFAPFSDRDAGTLALFADQAAFAIENARVHAAARRRSAELEAILNANQSIQSSPDLDTRLREIVRHAAALSGAAAARILLLEPDTRCLRSRVGIGLEPDEEFVIPLGESFSGQVAVTGVPLQVADTRGDARLRLGQHAWEHGLISYLGLPVKFLQQLLGVLVLNTTTARNYRPEEIALLMVFADQAGIAIENARLFAEVTKSYQALQTAQAESVRHEKLRALGQMSAGIAHDLNNTLATILGQAELLRLRAGDPDIQQSLTILEKAASDGAQVVRRLQDFGRQRRGRPLSSLALGPLVQETLEITRPRWKDEPQRKGSVIHVRTNLETVPPVLGYAPEIREALTNLIFNAVDAMPDGGTLSFSAAAAPADGHQESGPWVELVITDTGRGMPESVRLQIFDPFFTTKGVRGTGLGLSVVYSIMERHGGRVDVESVPGQGTTFRLRFQAARRPASSPPAEAPARPVVPRRVLVVDDDPAVRMTLSTLLQTSGHVVSEAAGGAEALRLMASTGFELVITDLGMPEISGWELARAVKGTYPTVPVVLLTGWGEEISGESAEPGLVVRVLGKPVQLQQLLAVIHDATADHQP